MHEEIPWDPQAPDEPTIGAGISVRVGADWPIGLRDGEPFRVAAASLGFTFGVTWRGTVGRIFKTKRLSEVAGDDGTLDEQADEVVTWTRDVLAQFETLEPRTDDGSEGADLAEQEAS